MDRDQREITLDIETFSVPKVVRDAGVELVARFQQIPTVALLL